MLFDAVPEAFESRFVEADSRLLGIGPDVGNGQLIRLFRVDTGCRGFGGGTPEKGAESSAKAAFHGICGLVLGGGVGAPIAADGRV